MRIGLDDDTCYYLYKGMLITGPFYLHNKFSFDESLGNIKEEDLINCASYDGHEIGCWILPPKDDTKLLGVDFEWICLDEYSIWTRERLEHPIVGKILRETMTSIPLLKTHLLLLGINPDEDT